MVAIASKGGSYFLIAFKSPYFPEAPLVAPVIPPPFPLFFCMKIRKKRGRRYLKQLRALSKIRFMTKPFLTAHGRRRVASQCTKPCRIAYFGGRRPFRKRITP
jgi:hypothetical protein